MPRKKEKVPREKRADKKRRLADEKKADAGISRIKVNVEARISSFTSDIFLPTLSEESYQSENSQHIIATSLVFLYFNEKWLISVALIDLLYFFLDSYILTFDKTPTEVIRPYFYVFHISLLVVVIVDIGLSIAHKAMKRTAAMAPYKSVHPMIIAANIFSVLMFFVMIAKPNRNIELLQMMCAFLRTCVKFGQCYFKASHVIIPSYIRVLKVMAVLFALVHMLAWYWMYNDATLSQFDCERTQNNWLYDPSHLSLRCGYQFAKGNSKEPVRNSLTSYEYYALCWYFVMDGLTSNGFGGASGANTGEQLGEMFMVIGGVFIMQGLVLCCYIISKTHQGRTYHKSVNNNAHMDDFLANNHVPPRLKYAIKDYYNKFAMKRLSQREPVLFQVLPTALKTQVFLDKYWYAIKKSYFFANASDPLKCEVAKIMRSATYSTGETVFHVGRDRHDMFFIAKGSVIVLSEADTESTILTLGVGSCMGTITLVYKRLAKIMIKASSQCEMHVLHKRDLWMMLSTKCRNSQTSKEILSKAKIKIRAAKLSIRMNKKAPSLAMSIAKKNMPMEVDLWQYTLNPDLDSPYMLSSMSNITYVDKIFVRTTWPWKFHPHTELMRIWDSVVLVLVFIMGLTYPYQNVVLPNQQPYWFDLITLAMAIIYPLDVGIKILTAIEDEDKLETAIPRNLEVRLKQWTFVCDVIAAVPFELIMMLSSYFPNWVIYKPILRMLLVNRLFKLNKVERLFRFLERTHKWSIFKLRSLKYTVYIFYLGYILSCIHYKCYCDDYNVCDSNSWIVLVLHSNSSVYRFLHVYNHMMFSLSGEIEARVSQITDIYIIIALCAIALWITIWMKADLYITYNVTYRKKENYTLMLDGLIKFLSSNETNPELTHRFEQYLTLQWVYLKGMDEKMLLQDISKVLLADLGNHRFLDIIAQEPLFNKLEVEVLKKLVEKCKTVFVPPNELLVYEGQIIHDLYIIENGYCEVACSTSTRIIKVLNPRDSFCLLEMFLGHPSYFTYRACTHCLVIKLEKKAIMNIFSQYTGLRQQISKVVSEIGSTLKATRLFSKKEAILHMSLTTEDVENKSWFVFPKNKRHRLYYDYWRPIKYNMFTSRVINWLMMRRTILPDGNFIIIYERIHMIIVILTCMYVPLMHFYRVYWLGVFYLSSIFDIAAIIDMYIKLHLCYYTDKGLLVSHPKLTAYHYLTSSFLIDLLSMFPIEKILDLQDYYLSNMCDNKWKFLSSFNRFLQLYRFNGLFYHRNVFTRVSVLECIAYCAPLLLMTYNVLTVLTMFVSSRVISNHSTTIIYPKDGYRVWDNRRGNDLFDYHMSSAFWTVMIFNSMAGVAQKVIDDQMFITLLGTFIGSYANIFIPIIMMTAQTRMNSKLMANQQYAKELKVFLKDDRLPSTLQKIIMVHFEYQWNRTGGLNAIEIINRCHDALRDEWIIRFFSDVLKLVPLVSDEVCGEVSRQLGYHLQEKYCLEETVIIDYNDIIDTVYIVRRGEVSVMDSMDNILNVLGVGSMFGHIDSVKATRSMVKVVSVSSVDLWYMKTSTMYEVTTHIPHFSGKLSYYIRLLNTAYVLGNCPVKTQFEVGRRQTKEFLPGNTIQSKVKKWISIVRGISSKYTEWLFVVSSYGSAYFTIYMVAFGTDYYLVVNESIFYAFEFVSYAQIMTNFLVPRFTNIGQRLDRRSAVIVYLKTTFALHLFSVLPFELIGLFFSDKYAYLDDMFRMNRIVKLYSVYTFFSKYYNDLSTNVIKINLVGIFAETLLAIHVLGSVGYYISCPQNDCNPESWVYNPATNESLCSNTYLCSMYYATMIFSQAGDETWFPRYTLDRAAVVLFVSVSRLFVNMIVGQIMTVVIHFTFTLQSFHKDLSMLKIFFGHSMVSQELCWNLMEYMEWIWIYKKAKQIPVFAENMPLHLMVAYKIRLYGYHIYNNPIFNTCHTDFVRQLIGTLQVHAYFKNDVICKQGEINETMYFIQKGIVHVQLETQDTDTVIDELWEGDSFGIVQGLFPCVPHGFTFVSKSVTVIVSLTMSNWRQLLIFFPASKYRIYDNFEIY